MAQRTATLGAPPCTRSPAQWVAGAVGAAFLLVGILGFVPGATTGHDSLAVAGHDSGAELLGLFRVNVLHNVVHLLFGLAGLGMARAAATARTFLDSGGVAYLVLWLYGLALDLHSAANVVALNTADNWLHLALGAGMVALGSLLPTAVPAVARVS